MVSSLLRALLPNSWYASLQENKRRLCGEYAASSFSQEGEDLVLARLFEGKANGFYVDVGAFHPIKYSNTYRFYRLGWHGINIDAMPGSMTLFKKWRPRDVNLEAAIAEKEGNLVYHAFAEAALNGFSQELSERRIANGSRLLFRREVPARTLASVLEAELPPATAIDFLSVDVEGLDLPVLRSNDWNRFRPAVVLVESLHLGLEDIAGTEVARFMASQRYRLVAKTVNTLFFAAEESAGKLPGLAVGEGRG
ncbi:FkbM family methyltransferase [Geomonas sp. Red32]|uniref:FkbM family methyltransferase n=1 Tax=Geomonas sp. Red32 TaxID=2912856 RepID=UPI00202CDF98|nr:FkbM family methyltransferase [Geomonas sp. Red32]MCM0081366.1 FkbM family methyltransferase [Geomonas sp. Red32]